MWRSSTGTARGRRWACTPTATSGDPSPVVSFSVGDTGVFRFGSVTDRRRPWVDVPLESGDLFVFGGPARLAFHGVPKVLAGTSDPATGVAGGRLNITVRSSGLGDRAVPPR